MGAQPGRDESLPCKPNSREGVGRPALWPPWPFTAAESAREGRIPPLRVNRERDLAAGFGGVRAPRPTHGFSSGAVGRPALWPPWPFAGVRNFAGYACRGRRPRRPAKGSSPALQINRERGATVNLRAGHARPLQSGFHSIHRITFVASTKSCDSYRCCAPSFWAKTFSSTYSSRRFRAQRLAAASSSPPMPRPR